MRKKGRTDLSSDEFRVFFTIWQHSLAISSRVFEKVALEDLAIFIGTTLKTRFGDPSQPQNHMKEKGKGRSQP